jgi:putative spermidine/putrescine transport system substrate-binding protein
VKIWKWFIPVILISLLLILVGCGNKTATQDNKTESLPKTDRVVVGVYSGDWEKQIRAAGLDKFAQETGIKVDVVPGADAEWFTKLKAANGNNPPYDILILQPDTIQRAISANLLQPIDQKQVPNLADLYPSINKQFTKDNQVYAAGFSMGQLGIAYREDLVPVKPTAWSDLWNPQYKGHVGVSPLTYAAGLQFFSALVHSEGGQEKNTADVDKAFNKLAELKNNAVSFPENAGSIQTLLQRGDAWLIPWWDGRVFALQKSDMKIGFVYPKDGPVAAVASWAIAKGSPNMANAYKLLNYLSGPDVQKSFGEASFYGMSNKNVVYNDELKSKVHVGEEYYNALTWVDYNTATPNLAAWTARWSQTMGGK